MKKVIILIIGTKIIKNMEEVMILLYGKKFI